MEHLPFVRDLQDTAALFCCCLCQGEIYLGEDYYQTDGGPVCRDCLRCGLGEILVPPHAVAVAAGEAVE